MNSYGTDFFMVNFWFSGFAVEEKKERKKKPPRKEREGLDQISRAYCNASINGAFYLFIY